MALIQEGTYEGFTVAASIYEAPSGAVMCSMVVDVGGTHLKGGICLVQKDGTLSERGFKDVQLIFGWSEWDWAKWDQEPEAFAGAAVQAVVETVQGERGEFSSIKYINPPGGGQRLEKANAKGLAAKYGAKTRALFGGSSQRASASGTTADKDGTKGTEGTKMTPSPQPSPLKGEGEERGGRTPPPSPPTVAVAPSTMEECWEQFCQVNASKTELELYDLWPKFVKEVTGKTQMEVTPQGWGKVRDAIGGMLPY
ncbi:MAG: hypothetical protein WCL49_12700 [bacterium]